MNLSVFIKKIGEDVNVTTTTLIQNVRYFNYITTPYASLDQTSNYGHVDIGGEDCKLLLVTIEVGENKDHIEQLHLFKMADKDVSVLHDVMAKLMTKQFREDDLMLAITYGPESVKIELLQDIGYPTIRYDTLVNAKVTLYPDIPSEMTI